MVIAALLASGPLPRTIGDIVISCAPGHGRATQPCIVNLGARECGRPRRLASRRRADIGSGNSL